MSALITLEQQSTLKQLAESAGRHGMELALKKVPLDRAASQRVQARGDELKWAVADAVIAKVRELSADPSVDPRFKFMKSFFLPVPEGYVHETRLASFGKEHRKAFYYYNQAITDKNFPNPTVRLTPGRRPFVKIFNITARVTSDDCLSFLRANQVLLVGAQGASLVAQYAREELPKGRWYVSFDEKERLYKDADGDHRVPDVFAYSGGGFDFSLGYFGGDWRGDYSLLCFCDESSES